MLERSEILHGLEYLIRQAHRGGHCHARRAKLLLWHHQDSYQY